MSANATQAATTSGFPEFTGEPHYVEGYVPCSYDSPHSSLHQLSTWVGMGLILSSVVGIGTWVFGAGSYVVGSQADWSFYVILGVCFMLFCWIAGGFLIHHGRRHYREYRRRTGRIH